MYFGTRDRANAYEITKGPRLNPPISHFLKNIYLVVTVEKTKIKKKMPGMVQFKG